MKDLKTTLIQRDNLTESKADDLISDARERLMQLIEDGDFDAAFDVCGDEFGLEPDYLEDLLY